jgi:hypothetical protein
MDTGL